MNEIIECAIDAARAAADVIRRGALERGELVVEEKSDFDYVSRIDRDSEAAIRSHILSRFPQHSFLGEESGESLGSPSSDWQWIVDPLDGTTNFLRDIPHYAVSIAALRNNTIEHAVVLDVAKDELFRASLGEGAFVNNQALMPSTEREYQGALLSTGVPFSGKNLAEVDAFTNTMRDLLAHGTSGIRRLGSAALDLAYVAAGRYDGFWEANLKPWDIAAGVLLAKEAGLVVSDFLGGEGYLESGDIIAAPTKIHEVMVSVTQARYRR